MEPIDAALAAIAALEPGEKLVYTQIAKKFGVDRRTLARRHQGKTASRYVEAQNHRLTVRGTAPNRDLVRRLASNIAQKDIGYHWVDRFIQRYPELLQSKRATPMDRSRHRADSERKYRLYFELLRDKIAQYKIEPRHIYNMDEKGFMIGVQSRSIRIFSKASLRSRSRRTIIQDGNREWITLIACICADGSHLDPSIIYSSQSGSIQNSWLQGFDPEIHSARITTSPTGWSNDDIGLQWLKQVFDPATKPKARSSYRLLFIDGHHSHLTMDFINYCDQNKILIAVYPPHATHTLQPLDVGLFKPLSTAYSNELSSFMDRCHGLLPITKSHFFPLFWRAWQVSFKESTILQAFEATGISPFNPEVVLQKFKAAPANNNREEIEISTSDWRTIRQLIDSAINYKQSRTISKLNRTVMKLSADITLLQRENEQLRAALIDERQRKQRSQPGTLELSEDYHGGAGFWSPRKVREARSLYEQKQRDREELQHQKAITMKAREEAKLLKARELDARRRARAEANLLREKQKADEAAQRAARQAARKQLQKAIKTSQIGKKIRFKRRTKPTPKKIIRGGGGGAAQPADSTAAPLTPRSRCGRDIKLPAKYR